MNTSRSDKVSYGIFLLSIAGAFLSAVLIARGVLPQPFWFLTIFLIAFGTMMYNRRNYNAAKRATEERRRQRAIRKNQSHNRYL